MIHFQQSLPESGGVTVPEAIEVVAALAVDALSLGQPAMIEERRMGELGLTVETLSSIADENDCEISGPYQGASDDGMYFLIHEALRLPPFPYNVLVSTTPAEVETAAAEFSAWLDARGTGFQIRCRPELGAVHIRTMEFGLAVDFVDERGGMILTPEETGRLFSENCDSLPVDLAEQSRRRDACATSTATRGMSRR